MKRLLRQFSGIRVFGLTLLLTCIACGDVQLPAVTPQKIDNAPTFVIGQIVLSIYTYRHGFTSLPMEKANTSIVMASKNEPAI